MKFVILALIATAFTQNLFAQDGANTQSPQLLNAYYKVKDALVSSNPATAATSAGELIQAINMTDKLTLKENLRSSLLNDASAISQSKDLKSQREKFATLSNNMFELAKTLKLASDPVYQQYCPMKKASWLSNDKAIKNPYYGNAMLTCGSVKTTL